MKWLVRIGLGFVLAFILLYGFVWLRSVMPATVPDRDLRLPRASIPEGSNAFDVLQVAGSRLWWPEAQNQQIYDLGNNTNWNGGLANTFLANNREALAGWDAATKLTDLQVSEILQINDPMPYLSLWKKLSVLAEVRENSLFHSGRDQEAFDQIVSHIQLGRRMQDARGVLITYLVGTSVRVMGLRQMQQWVGKTHLSPRQLQGYIRQLELETDDEGAVFANAIRAEYQWQMKTLEAIRKGGIRDPETGRDYPRPTRLVPTLNVSKTKALFAKASLMLIKAAPHHYSEAKLPDLDTRPGPVSLILSGNLAGQVIYYMTMPAVVQLMEKKSQGEAQLQATRTILALRAYQLAHGQLPSGLAALVPDFLEEVPADDFDGQPLRYSPERKLVYSVGRNLKDDGGEGRLDIVYKFDF